MFASHYDTRLRLHRSGMLIRVRLREPLPLEGGVAYVSDSSSLPQWRLSRMSRRPIDGKTVVKARGGGRWIRC